MQHDMGNAAALYETVIIRGVSYFVGYDPGTGNLVKKKKLVDSWRNLELSPYQEESHTAYEFGSE